MPKDIIQINTVVTSQGTIALYALTQDGRIFEKLPGVQGSPWTPVV